MSDCFSGVSIPSGKSPRSLAFDALEAILRKGSTYDHFVRSNFRQIDGLSNQDRRFFEFLTKGTLRYLPRLDFCWKKQVKKPNKLPARLANLLRLGTFELLLSQQKNHAVVYETVELAKKLKLGSMSSLVNGVLRSILREEKALRANWDVFHAQDPEPSTCVPHWIFDLFISQFGLEAAIRICESFLKEPSVVVHQIKEQEHTPYLEPSTLCPGAFKVISPREFFKDDQLRRNYYVQGEAAQWVVKLASSNDPRKIWDVCAAPGGKTMGLAFQNPKSQILSTDISESRLELLHENFKFFGDSDRAEVEVRKVGKTSFGFEPDHDFDSVLVDAPCSGLGILASHPDGKWNRKKEDMEPFPDIQLDLLSRTSKFLKPGGVLTYSVCTILREESENVILKFLKSASGRDFTLLRSDALLKSHEKHFFRASTGVFCLPGFSFQEGFFISQLQRKK